MPTMKSSRLPDDWLARTVAANPIRKLEDGNILTCPVRLAFCHIVKPNPNAKNDDGTPKATASYEVTMLFPPGGMEQINSVLWPEVYAMFKAGFPQNINGQGQPFGLHMPWRDQGEKQQFTGYTPGLPFIRATTQYKPQIVDSAMNPIVDEGRVYAGVWAICMINLFEFGRSPPRPKKGVSIGLQSVMIIADDEKLAGGAPDAAKAFAGVSVEAKYDPAAAFAGHTPGAPPPPPGSIMPPATMVAPPPPAPGGYMQAPPLPPAAPAAVTMESLGL